MNLGNKEHIESTESMNFLTMASQLDEKQDTVVAQREFVTDYVVGKMEDRYEEKTLEMSILRWLQGEYDEFWVEKEEYIS